MNSGSYLTTHAVGKTFSLGGTPISVLQDVSLSIDRGESVAIMGRSGSGKSTLLNLLGLLDSPTSGTVTIDGSNAAELSEGARARLRGSSIGFVYQQFHLIDHRTALENVAEPLLFGPARLVVTRRRRCLELLDQVGLSHRVSSMPHHLSGGEQQRVAIARALARGPKLICADEPTGALDSTTGELVLDLLFGIVRSTDAAIVLATHDDRVAARADRVIHLADGRIGGEAA